jgi:hypothetical protein
MSRLACVRVAVAVLCWPALAPADSAPLTVKRRTDTTEEDLR